MMKDPFREILSGDAAPDTFSDELYARTLDRLRQARAGAASPVADLLPRRRTGGGVAVIALALTVAAGLWFASRSEPSPTERPVALLPLIEDLSESIGSWGDLAGEPSRMTNDQLALLHEDATRFGRFLGDRLPTLPDAAASN
jgi:hypothetical protein